MALRPLNVVDNQVVFGTRELAVLPLKVNISNPTRQTYLLETQRIMLLDAAGKRVKPISEGESPFPAPSLTDRPVGPGASIQGYLYYPLGTYTGAARVAGRSAQSGARGVQRRIQSVVNEGNSKTEWRTAHDRQIVRGAD